MKKVFVSMLVVFTILTSFSLYAATGKKPGVSNDVLEGKLNINAATSIELQMLPGIGKKKADAIVVYRNANGPFKSVNDLDKIKGIGKAKLNAIRPFCVLDGKSTLKVVK
jgi:competence protein ComEA